MNKNIKIELIIATSLILAGLIIFGGVMTVLGWDFKKLSTVKYETSTYEITEEFNNILINSNTTDIEILPSENNKTTVTCYEEATLKHDVFVEGETLKIELNDTRKWYDRISINFSIPKIKIYLPASEYGTLTVDSSTSDIMISGGFKFTDVSVSLSTGDIEVTDISANTASLFVTTGEIQAKNLTCTENITLALTTGDVELENISCNDLSSSGSTGDISLENVIASGKLTIKRTTGDIEFDGCDAAEISVKTDTGNITGSLLTEKIFIAETDTGRINIPKSTSGGICEIYTDTGDIKITVK